MLFIQNPAALQAHIDQSRCHPRLWSAIYSWLITPTTIPVTSSMSPVGGLLEILFQAGRHSPASLRRGGRFRQSPEKERTQRPPSADTSALEKNDNYPPLSWCLDKEGGNQPCLCCDRPLCLCSLLKVQCKIFVLIYYFYIGESSIYCP